jgi:hypothetical protein
MTSALARAGDGSPRPGHRGRNGARCGDTAVPGSAVRGVATGQPHLNFTAGPQNNSHDAKNGFFDEYHHRIG